MTALQCITMLYTATTSRHIAGRWACGLPVNSQLLKQEYGTNGTEYRASETYIKVTSEDGTEGADEIAVSSAPSRTYRCVTQSVDASKGHSTAYTSRR